MREFTTRAYVSGQLGRVGSWALLGALLVLVAGCGGGEREVENAGTGRADTTAPVQLPAATPGPGSPTEAQFVALGDSIYHGQAAGGICYTCHGPDANGTALAPDLTDQQWLNGDGNLEFITNVVRNGVQQPKQFPGPMPAFGGTLNDQQVRAVAAYVYSLSNAP